MKKDKETRFIIVGAGAAGLTAAETLKEKGYTNIVILEKESYSGGKCRSVEYDGRSFELGAGIISANNITIMNLVEKYNMPLSPVEFCINNLYNSVNGNLCEDTFSIPEKISYFWQLLLRYHRLLLQFPGVQKPGFLNCEPELFDNFHHWAAINKIPLVEDNFERFFTGFGYGYWEEIPAAYTLKYNDWASLVSFVKREIYVFPQGIQQLWQKIAEQYLVFYNTEINKIKRLEGHIAVDTNNGEFMADILLLCCPLEVSLSFMDVSEMEVKLFSKIKYTEYITFVCRLENFPDQTGFIPDNFNASKKGYPVFWYKRYADSDIYTIYVLSDFTISDDIIEQNIADSIHKLGGKLLKKEQIVKWKYFPHVDTKEMQNGFYTKLEHLQGTNNTYYLGELLNFSTVELTAIYSKTLIEQYF